MQKIESNSTQKKFNLCLIIALASLALCLLLIIVCEQHADLYAFRYWGYDMLEYGPYRFYSHGWGSASDYPPIYVSICGVMAASCNLFHANSYWQRFFFRLPSALILFASIFVFYKLLKHFVKSEKTVIILTVLYAFSPASIINIVWGQCDCFTLFYMLLACLMFVDKKYFLTMLTCTLAILTKAQFFFVIPVFGFAVLWRSIKEKRLKRFFVDLAICLLIYFIVYFPFLLEKMQQGNFFYLLQILFEQVGHYKYFTTNAFNLFTGLNLNFVGYPDWYMFINFGILIGIVVLCCVLIAKNDSDINVVLLSAFILTAIFMLSTNMHERYMHGALGTTMIAAYALNNKKLIIANWILYFAQFINSCFSWWLFNGAGFNCNSIAIIVSLISVAAFFIMTIEATKLTFTKEKDKNYAKYESHKE